MDEITVTPKKAAEALKACIAAEQPVCLWGSPGIGKSQIVHQTSVELGLSFKDVRAVLLDPVDLRGLPHVATNEAGQTVSAWAQPAFLPQDGNGVIFLDELNRAPVMVQNACFQLVLDRKLGEYNLPDGWRVVAACNRESDGGGIQRMPQALANRFLHLHLVPDLDDWCSWALSVGSINPMVVAFLRFRPDLLHQFSKDEKAFPTPRSWEFVSKVVGKSSKDVELALISGTVGHGAAIEFMAFYELFKSLPSIDAILLDPSNAAVPASPATCYAVASALANRADCQNFGRVVTYLDRLPKEYAVCSVKDAMARTPSLSASPEFTQWAVANASLL